MVCIFEKLEPNKFEILEMLEQKLGKFNSKLKLKLKNFIFLGLVMCSNSKFLCSRKLKFDEM